MKLSFSFKSIELIIFFVDFLIVKIINGVKMRTFRIIFVLSFLLLLNTSYSQWGLLRTLGIGGGVHFGVLSPDLSDLNSEFKRVGLPEFNKPFFGFGGGGNVSIGGIRLGGFGIGGTQSNEKVRYFSGNYYTSKITIDYGLGFGTIGYELIHRKKYALSFDLGIGGGDIDIFISDRTSDFNYWDETLLIPVNTTNISRTLNYSFFSLQPMISFEFYYSNLLKIFLSGDYNFILSDRWRKDGYLNLVNVPKLNFNGFSIRIGIYAGLFF